MSGANKILEDLERSQKQRSRDLLEFALETGRNQGRVIATTYGDAEKAIAELDQIDSDQLAEEIRNLFSLSRQVGDLELAQYVATFTNGLIEGVRQWESER